MTAADEQHIAARAAAAAAAVASRLAGMPVSPLVLHHSRHVSVLLQPIETVARVAPLDPNGTGALARELEIAQHLLMRGAPVVAASTRYPAGPYVHGGFAMSLWSYVEHRSVDHDNQAQVALAARALRQLHEALADVPGPLPSFLMRIEECGALLADPSKLVALAAPDRGALRQIYGSLMKRLARCQVPQVPIHGDAHLGNVLLTASGPCWADLDSVSVGPREWDICGPGVLSAFEPVDPECYEVMHLLRSLCVSVWCWEKPHLAGKLEAARYHLGYLQSRRLTARS